MRVMMKHDLPPGEGGPSEQTPEMTAWQAAHEPTLTLRVWLGTDGRRFLLHFGWTKEIAGRDVFERPIDDMLQAVLGALTQLYAVADALTAARKIKGELDDFAAAVGGES